MKAMKIVPDADGFRLSPGLRADPKKVAELLQPSPLLELLWAARSLESAANDLLYIPDAPESRPARRVAEDVLDAAKNNLRKVLGDA